MKNNINKLILIALLINNVAKNEESNTYSYNKKIKSTKSPIKKKIYQSIREQLDNQTISNKNYRINQEKKNIPIRDDYSETMQERIKIKEIYNTKNKENPTKETVNQKKKSNTINHFLIKNYSLIQKKLENNFNINKNSLFFSIALPIISHLISQGKDLSESITVAGQLITTSSFYKINQNKNTNLILPYLFDYQNNIIDEKEIDTYNKIATHILDNSIIFNPNNTIETERAINKLYNNLKRKNASIIVSLYDKTSFKSPELLETYGALEINKDIYRDLLKLPADSIDRQQIKTRSIKNLKNPTTEQYYSLFSELRQSIINYHFSDTEGKLHSIDKMIKRLRNKKCEIATIFILDEESVCFLVK